MHSLLIFPKIPTPFNAHHEELHMTNSAILVTGGAGYIGSHVVKQLGARAEKIIVLDDLSTGFADAVVAGTFVQGSIEDQTLVGKLIQDHHIETVIHFAAKTIVPESVANPLKYYRCNTAATLSLLEACASHHIRHFIFSSTAAVYGMPNSPDCDETTPTEPINPYGMSKLMSENVLRDLGKAHPMRHVILRYFNVAGCDPAGQIGQNTKGATLLTKVAVETALGKRPQLNVFGTDYATHDGTGVRDYIHVEDLASAHLAALDYLRNNGASTTLNCGYGRGYSVKEVIAEVERQIGHALPVHYEARRAGDPPMLIAKADRIRQVLNWVPKHDRLEDIIASALAWEKHLSTLR